VPDDQFLAHACDIDILRTVSIRVPREITMEKLSKDELNRLAGRTAQDVISELSVADAAIDLLIHDESVSLETRGKLCLLREQVREAAVPAKRFILLSRTPEELQVLDLQKFLSDLYPLLRRLLPETIDIKVNVDTGIWRTRLSVMQFEEVFITLAVNARDSMPCGGTFGIRATNADEAACQSSSGLYLGGDHILIEISDNGIGIPAAHLKRIFDPFVITKAPACGFGLAKVYNTILNIDGHVNVDSEVSGGTTFKIFVPRYESDQVTKAELAKP
jgi:two-component system cell cycle sensor histidine kinase/response regulator CckA